MKTLASFVLKEGKQHSSIKFGLKGA